MHASNAAKIASQEIVCLQTQMYWWYVYISAGKLLLSLGARQVIEKRYDSYA